MTHLPFETISPFADPRAEFLVQKAVGNKFFTSLLDQYNARGDLSPKQWAIVDREIANAVAEVDINFGEIHDKLMGAADHLKKPALLLANNDGFEYRFSLAPANGANAGKLYVKVRGETEWGWGWAYLGKVDPETGDARCVGGLAVGKAEMLADMEQILKDGLDAAVLHYGRLTNNCGCCGRQLTEELSVKSGIGPICAERYNIDRTALAAA
jgi:hypothetical protein